MTNVALVYRNNTTYAITITRQYLYVGSHWLIKPVLHPRRRMCVINAENCTLTLVSVFQPFFCTI